MTINSISAARLNALARPEPVAAAPSQQSGGDAKLQAAFHDFVGQTFYGQMLSAMRQSVGKPAYMHGGRTEEVFQKQLDQVLAEKLSDATADTFCEPMYTLFTLPRP